MFRHQGVWLPDGEKHFPDWMSKNGEVVDGRGTYQMKKLREALTYVREWRCAVDVGAHVGFWSMQLAKRFERVKAFEPMATFRECWMTNMEKQGGELYAMALGSESGMVSMHYNPADSGGTHIAGGGDIEMRTLDSFNMNDVDFLKIDCEGYEFEVIKGAVITLARCRPVIIVEQKPHILKRNFNTEGAPAVDFLKTLGWRTVRVMSGDYIMVPNGTR